MQLVTALVITAISFFYSCFFSFFFGWTENTSEASY